MKNREKEENKAQKYQEGYIDKEKEQEGDLSYLYGGHSSLVQTFFLVQNFKLNFHDYQF